MWERVRGNPRPLVLIGIAVVLIIGFFVIVAPLFNTSGAPTAELGGVLPVRATVGTPLQVDVGFDNTGTSVISPTCIHATLGGPVQAKSVVFQGTDREPFKNGTACGGALNGQDTISLVIELTPQAAGTASVSLAPAQGSTVVGAALSGTIAIAAS